MFLVSCLSCCHAVIHTWEQRSLKDHLGERGLMKSWTQSLKESLPSYLQRRLTSSSSWSSLSKTWRDTQGLTLDTLSRPLTIWTTRSSMNNHLEGSWRELAINQSNRSSSTSWEGSTLMEMLRSALQSSLKASHQCSQMWYKDPKDTQDRKQESQTKPLSTSVQALTREKSSRFLRWTWNDPSRPPGSPQPE